MICILERSPRQQYSGRIFTVSETDNREISQNKFGEKVTGNEKSMPLRMEKERWT